VGIVIEVGWSVWRWDGRGAVLVVGGGGLLWWAVGGAEIV
jgi:hypothetical protein